MQKYYIHFIIKFKKKKVGKETQLVNMSEEAR